MLFSPSSVVPLDPFQGPQEQGTIGPSEHLEPLGAHSCSQAEDLGKTLTQATLAIPTLARVDAVPEDWPFLSSDKGAPGDPPRPAFMPQDHIPIQTPPRPRLPNHCLRPSDPPPIGLHLFFF